MAVGKLICQLKNRRNLNSISRNSFAVKAVCGALYLFRSTFLGIRDSTSSNLPKKEMHLCYVDNFLVTLLLYSLINQQKEPQDSYIENLRTTQNDWNKQKLNFEKYLRTAELPSCIYTCHFMWANLQQLPNHISIFFRWFKIELYRYHFW